MAESEGLVEALTAALAEKSTRIETVRSAGGDTSGLKRQVAQIELDLAKAKARVATELHAVPGVATLMRQVEQLQSDLAAAHSTIERLQGAPVA